MAKNAASPLICIAAIAGAHGIRGEVKLKPFTADPLACVGYGPLMDEAGRVILTPSKARMAKKFVVTSGPEISTREAADALKSVKLYVPRAALPAEDEDEFYYADLMGLDVFDEQDVHHGTIKALHDFGGGDILEIIKPGEKSWYHPFTKAAVPFVDIPGRRVIIEIVEADEALEPEIADDADSA